MNDEVSQIRELATKFRNAIEACDKTKLSICLQRFPHGACRDASLLLAKFLELNGHVGFFCNLGMRADHSHAWLQRDDLVVDITGDQFDDCDDRVCVTRGSAWHLKFDVDSIGTADFAVYDRHATLKNDLERVSRHL